VRDDVIAQLSAKTGLTRLADAAALLDGLVLGDFEDFLTVPAGRLLEGDGAAVGDGRGQDAMSRS
jgi:hypothetical protein